jgi:hypothetical protein
MRRMTAMAVLAFLGWSACAAESSCVGCHTNPATMKSLFVPPAQTASEGEG